MEAPKTKVLTKQDFDLTLKRDRKARFRDTYRELYTLDSIERIMKVEIDCHSAKSLQARKRDFLSLPTLEEFKTSFLESYWELSGIDLSNVLVAGGAVQKILCNYFEEDGGDVDLFIYGLSSQEEATKRVEKLVEDLSMKFLFERCWEFIPGQSEANKIDKFNKYALDRGVIRRSKYFIQIGKYQIIFRLYKDINEILYGFDLGSSAVGFDFDNIYFSEMGKLAYSTGYNIVDTTRRSTTYEKRLVKYFNRGFGVILPCLRTSSTRNCELPCLISKREESLHTAQQGNLRYTDNSSTGYSGLSLHKVAESQIHLGVVDIKYPEIPKHCFTFETIREFVSLNNPLWMKASESCPGFGHSYKSLFHNLSEEEILKAFPLFKEGRDVKKFFEDAYKASYISKAKAFNKMIEKVSWITENPGTQLTSSINPILKHPKDWYGECYVKYPIGLNPVVVGLIYLSHKTEGIFSLLPVELVEAILELVFWSP